MYLPAIVMVGFYFDKRRALATGIAVCGSGIGGFIFAPLCEFLISTYGWKGATWIIAGICLNGVVTGCLFRPLEENQPKKKLKVLHVEIAEGTDKKSNGTAIVGNGIGDYSNKNGCLRPSEVINRTRDYQDNNENNIKDINSKNNQKTSIFNKDPKRDAVASLVPDSKDRDIVLLSVQNLEKEMPKTLTNSTGNNKTPNIVETDRNSKNISMGFVNTAFSQSFTDISAAKIAEDTDAHDLTCAVNMRDEPNTGNSANANGINRKQETPSGQHKVVLNEETSCLVKCIHNKYMDFSILLNPVFAVYGLSCFMVMAGKYVILSC